MQFTPEAAERILTYMKENNIDEAGLRISATKDNDKVNYCVYWEDQELMEDIVIIQEGLKIHVTPDSNQLLDNTIVFTSMEEGIEGLFIMENQSDCSSCAIDCF